ncbi:hypothetical protein SAMN05216272_109117 [Pseudomonas panipatensis]|jgi:hypothetical protein|uniref:Uncharacterized protein n=1 Tax=Pseudomonas panipatensis TaxID=428992 RepID=A0A1G8KMU7_9PSED|nr:hypothetical protein SAMN05216272_109117 [Pseudomonas panipatensis]SMP70023.1 hypothetical protein SAMN06295951_109117 [Pseudomonas panipatensis]
MSVRELASRPLRRDASLLFYLLAAAWLLCSGV